MNRRTLSTILLLAFATCTADRTAPREAAFAALVTPAAPIGLPAPPVPALATVTALNQTATPRRDVVTTVVPFPQAADYRGEPLAVDGHAIDVRQLGAAWPDGAWRQAVVHVPVHLGAGERRALEVRRTDVGPGLFEWGPGVVAALPAWSFAIRAGGAVGPFTSWTVTEWTPLVRSIRARARVPGTPVWGELIVELGSGLDHARLWLTVGDSDPRDPEVSHVLPRVEFLERGGELVLEHPAMAQVGAPVQGITTALLDPGSRWADGEAITIHGRLLFRAASRDTGTLDAEARAPVLAVADWRGTGAFGPWGEPAALAGLDAARAAQVAAAAMAQVPVAWTPVAPWGPLPLGLSRFPGQTGDQPDFAATVCNQEASGFPDRLRALAWSCRREAGRPTHERAVDGSPARLAGERLWDCRRDSRISLSMGGKSRNLAPLGTPPDGHQFVGRDQEHWSANYALAWALLTGDRWGLAEAEHIAELWLGMVKDGTSGSTYLDHIATAERGEGRPLQAGALLWLVTGRLDVRDRLLARVNRVIAQEWTGKDAAPVRPLRARYDLPALPHWRCWEAGLSAMGLDAVAQVTGDPAARAIADAVAGTVASHGVWQTGGRWVCGWSVDWIAGGAAGGKRTEAEDDFLPWVGGALVVAARAGGMSGAASLAQLRTAAAADWRVAEWCAVR